MSESVEVSRRALFREVDKLRNELMTISSQCSLISSELGRLKRNIKSFKPERDNKRLEKRGRYKLGERVTWTSRGVIHEGTIILIVEPRNYPDIQFRQSGLEREYNVRTRGYYRYEESYVIEDNEGQQWWPRVGWLHRV